MFQVLGVSLRNGSLKFHSPIYVVILLNLEFWALGMFAVSYSVNNPTRQ